jgi:ribonuclease Z
MMSLYSSDQWPGFFRMPTNRVPGAPGAIVLEDDELRITSAPTKHTVPSIGLRIENRASGLAATYSSDTEPCDAVMQLAQGAAILFHESTGEGPGHSGPAEAGAIARRAGVSRLVLVHYPPAAEDHATWTDQASQEFEGPVCLANDFDEFEF